VDKVYFLVEGLIEYRMRCGMRSPRAMDSEDSSMVEIVQEGQWLSEAAIWVKWFHMGKAIARVYSVLCILSVPALHQVIKEYADLLPSCCAYARIFVKDLRSQGVSMSDLPGAESHVEDMAREAFGVEGATAEERALAQHHGITRRHGVKATLRRGFSLISRRSAATGREGRRPTRVGGFAHWLGGSEKSGAPPSRGSSLECSEASVAQEHASDCQGSVSSSQPTTPRATPPHASVMAGPGLATI